MAWTINTFAHVARKQDLIDLSLQIQSKIYTLVNIEMSDAFTKFREQTKCHISNPSRWWRHRFIRIKLTRCRWREGLSSLQSTHVDFFSPQQKAEFLRFKGELLWNLGQCEEAHQSFSSSIQTFENSSAAWLVWGRFCDQQFTETKDLVWAEHSISCYLQALRGGTDKARCVSEKLSRHLDIMTRKLVIKIELIKNL